MKAKYLPSIVFSLCMVLENLSFTSERLGQDEYQLLDKLRREMPSIIHIGPLAIANLNLNHKGSVIAAQPGEKVYGMLNFQYDTSDLEPESLNQIIIGISGSGSQKCIFNELGYRCGDGITSFYLQAPEFPGIYEVKCKFEQAYSVKEALNQWSEEDENGVITIGKVVVRE